MKVVVLNTSLLMMEPLANNRLDSTFWLAVKRDMEKHPQLNPRDIIRFNLVMHRKGGIGDTINRATTDI